MPTEEQFVGLGKPHVDAGKKHLLYSEMEVLTSLKKINNYKKFKKEELAIKNLLRKVITEMKKEMETIIQYIPQIRVKETSAVVVKTTPVKRDALEEEIEKIRNKIAMLS